MREQPELDVYKVPTDSLVPYANNAKIHTITQVDQIASSIQEFGFNDPIAVWENADGEREIVEGHGRVLAAEKLGLDVVPVIYLNHLSDAQRRAYTHVHNQLNMNTGWDFEILDAEIEELDFDFEDYGFNVESSSSFDPSDFFSETEDSSNKEPKTIKCPHCGEEIEI